MILNDVSVEGVIRMGRWRDPRSTKPYLQALPCVLAEIALPESVTDWQFAVAQPFQVFLEAVSQSQ